MKLQQKKSFEPVTIVLETREEADAFFGIVAGTKDTTSEKLSNELCDWFSNNYQ